MANRPRLDFEQVNELAERFKLRIEANYKGELARPMRRAQFSLKAWNRRHVLLFQHFALTPGDWESLAKDLACKHVPGFRTAKSGRPRDYARALAKLELNLQKLQGRQEFKTRGRPAGSTRERDRIELLDWEGLRKVLRTAGGPDPSDLAVARFEFEKTNGCYQKHRDSHRRRVKSRARQISRIRHRHQHSR